MNGYTLIQYTFLNCSVTKFLNIHKVVMNYHTNI